MFLQILILTLVSHALSWLSSLNAKDKEVLILYYIEGYSCKEIADMLKVSESAVKKKLERARKRLKEKYESEGR